MVNDVTMAETIVGAMMYMFFVAFSGGMGLLCAVGVGYKFYNRSKAKVSKGSVKRKQGVV